MHRFRVAAMTCGHCAATIEKAVKALDPGATITVDIAEREVAVQTMVDGDALAETLRGAGYESERLAA